MLAPDIAQAVNADPGAERDLVAAMTVFPDTIPTAAAIATPEHFSRPLYGEIFAALVSLHHDATPVTPTTLMGRLKDSGADPAIDCMFLADVMEYACHGAYVDVHAKRIVDLYRRRAISARAERLAVDLARADGDHSTILLSGLNDMAQLGAESETALPVEYMGADTNDRPTLAEPIVEGLLRRGEVGNLISGPKCWKSYSVHALALSAVCGWDWLGFQCRPSRVLLVDFELDRRTLQGRIYDVRQAMGVRPETIGDKLAVMSCRGQSVNLDTLESRLSTLPEGAYDLVIIDPLFKLFPKDFDENSNSDMADLYDRLVRLATGLDAALLVIHHASKGNQSEKGVTDVGAGAGAQSRAADAHLVLRPHAEDDCAVFGGVVRSFPPFEPIALRWGYPLWEVDRTLDPYDLRRQGARRRASTPATAEPAPRALDTRGFADAYLSAEPQTAAVIEGRAEEDGMSTRAAASMLRRAEAMGLAHRWKMPRDNKAYYATKPQPTMLEAER